MANISHLGTLAESQPLDLSQYAGQRASGTGFRAIPPPGRYTVRAPESFPDTAFSASKAGALLTQIDPTIVGGEHDGYQLRFVKVSAKVFMRTVKENGVETKVPASQVADYLKACGLNSTVSALPSEVANQIEQTAGMLYEVETDWKVWDKISQTEYTLRENADRFVKDEAGNPQPFIIVKDADGNDMRLRANVEVTKFIAASN
jgi:hypothetical protein